MELYGVLGWPITHSWSPLMHAAAYRETGLDAHYLPLAVRPERLEEALIGASALGFSGLNVTVPHKAALLPFLAEVSDEARLIGAVNTLARRGEAWAGFNTDARGFVRSLEEEGVPLRAARVVLLGTGGASRAVVVGLAGAGVAEITLIARRPEAAESLCREFAAAFPCSLRHATFDASLETTFAQAALLVHGTSATLGPADEVRAFVDTLPLHALPAGSAVVDLVYRPRETLLLRRARERGLQGVDGLGMLLHQGALAFELWTGQSAPLASMREALSRAADREEKASS